MKAAKTYRRRKAILSRLEMLSYRRNSLERRINPGHSSAYIPGPADEADRAWRDVPSAYKEREEVDAEMLSLARKAVELGGQGQRWVDRINSAAGLCLVSLEETAWEQVGGPGSDYVAVAWNICYHG